MAFIYTILAALCPRGFMFFAWIFTDWFSKAFETSLWPFLGFLIMPFTTLIYMAAMLNNEGSVTGGWVVLMIIAILIDFSANSTSASTIKK